MKVTVLGPGGSGKSTFIRAISQVAVISTEDKISDHTRDESSSENAVDFGRITIAPDVQLHLFSAPAEAEDVIWDAMTDGILGMVVVVDATRRETFSEAREILEKFGGFGFVSSVVAVNKWDVPGSSDMEETRRLLGVDDEIPVLPVTPSDRPASRRFCLRCCIPCSPRWKAAGLRSAARSISPNSYVIFRGTGDKQMKEASYRLQV